MEPRSDWRINANGKQGSMEEASRFIQEETQKAGRIMSETEWFKCPDKIAGTCIACWSQCKCAVKHEQKEECDRGIGNVCPACVPIKKE